MKLSDFVFEFLAGAGVRHVFMLPGGGVMHLNDSLGRCPGIRYVGCLHEQACAVAAEAYARVADDLGVALVTTGPGGTNAITGVAAAWQDSTPCLFISGQVKRSDLAGTSGVRQMGVQEIDIVSLVKPITKYAVTVMDPAKIRHHLEKALHLAKSGRPGPVWIDVPLDVQAADVDPGILEGFDPGADARPEGEGEPAEAAARAIDWLNGSERPVVLAGNGIRVAGACADFRNLVGLLGVPVLTTRLGVDLLPANHGLCFGMPGSIAARGSNFTLQNADWLLVLGARLDMALIAYEPKRLARGARKIMVNLDPAEMRKLGGILDLEVCTDAGRFIREMIRQAGCVERRDRSAWLDRCRDWQARYPFVQPKHRENAAGISVYAFSEILAEELTGEHIVLPGNAGVACELFLTAFRVKEGQRVFHNKGTGAMGFGPPAALGAALASSGRHVVCIDGDGGFQMNAQELETIRRLGLPVTFFVMNNQGYSSIRVSQSGYFGRLTGADASSNLTLPDPLKLAGAYGLRAVRISHPGDLKEKIREVLALPGPVVCDVMLIPDEVREPRVASYQKPDGSMASKPLEDMWPFLDREEFRANMIVEPVEE